MESSIENSRHYRNQSDADSQTSHECDSFYSPQLGFESPFGSNDDLQDANNSSPAKPPTSPGIFSVRKLGLPLRSTNHQQRLTRQKPDSISFHPPPPPPSMFALSLNEDTPPASTRAEKAPRLNGRPGPGPGVAGTTPAGAEDLEGRVIEKRRTEKLLASKSRPRVDFAGGGNVDEDFERFTLEKRRSERTMSTAMTVVPSSPQKGSGTVAKKMELWFRILEIIVCVISFSIMATDKNQGWTGDSFDRYKEYRYCVAVTVAGFAYATFQACCAAYKLVAEKQSYLFGCYFDFATDQTLAYLLMSASSAAATRVDDWVSNWGKDEFTEKATASITTSFIAFALFAVSSLISGHNLCSHS